MYRSPHVRVSDADREAIVARLSTATAEGRLTIDEFSERSHHAYAARTWGELSTVVYDLPTDLMAYPPAPVPPPAAAPGSRLPALAMIFGLATLPLLLCEGLPMSGISGVAGIVLGALSLRGPARLVRHSRAMAIAGLAGSSLGFLAMAAMVLSGFFAPDA